VFGKFAEVVIARADFDPRVRHADQRLFEIIVLQSGSAQHGAGASAVGAADEGLTAKLCKWIGHVAFLSKTRPDEGGYSAANISAKKKRKGHHPAWHDGPNFSEALLRHHPVLPLITTTWGICTTRRIDRIGSDSVRCCVDMALRVIVSETRAGAVGGV
jgi:hypothetical protein